MNPVFDAYAQYYDLIYQDKDYTGESDFVAGVIRKQLPEAQSILELGCGTGAHAESLARLGFTVHGIDMSEEMLARAEERKATLPSEISAKLSFSQGDVRSVRRDETYDAVISLFHVVSYQINNTDLQAVFETAAIHLAQGGIFLFDFWYGPAVLTQVPETRVKRLENEDIKVVRIAEPQSNMNKNSVDVNYDIFVEQKGTGNITRLQELHRMRYLFLPELDYYLDAESWAGHSASEWMGEGQLSGSNWSAFVVATRK